MVPYIRLSKSGRTGLFCFFVILFLLQIHSIAGLELKTLNLHAVAGAAGRTGQVLPVGGEVQQPERAGGVPPLRQRLQESGHQA